MKGIIVEVKDNFAAVLSEDGSITKLTDKNYSIGETVIMKNKKAKIIAAVSTTAAVLALTSIGALAYYTPVTYVSLDVNPSIEYSINTFDQVIDVNAVNDDGEEILEDLDLENMNINEAVDATVNELIDQGYIADDENGGVVITTSGDDEEAAQELAEELEEETQTNIDEQGKTAEVQAEAIGRERVEAARQLGVTPGKLNLVEKLIAAAPDPAAIDRNEWLNKPVKEINKTIKEYRKADKNADVNDDEDIDTDDDEDNQTTAPDQTAAPSATPKHTNKNTDKHTNKNTNKNTNKHQNKVTAAPGTTAAPDDNDELDQEQEQEQEQEQN